VADLNCEQHGFDGSAKRVFQSEETEHPLVHDEFALQIQLPDDCMFESGGLGIDTDKPLPLRCSSSMINVEFKC